VLLLLKIDFVLIVLAYLLGFFNPPPPPEGSSS
jgi:hypothetical protein